MGSTLILGRPRWDQLLSSGDPRWDQLLSSGTPDGINSYPRATPDGINSYPRPTPDGINSYPWAPPMGSTLILGRPDDLVGMDWVKSDPRPKGTCPLMGGICLFITSRHPSRLIEWAETLHGGGTGPWDRHRVGVSWPRPLGQRVRKKKNGGKCHFRPEPILAWPIKF